jgi:hypothetical protein
MLPEQPKRVPHPAEHGLRLRNIAAARLSARDQFPLARYSRFEDEHAAIMLCRHRPDQRGEHFVSVQSVAPLCNKHGELRGIPAPPR